MAQNLQSISCYPSISEFFQELDVQLHFETLKLVPEQEVQLSEQLLQVDQQMEMESAAWGTLAFSPLVFQLEQA